MPASKQRQNSNTMTKVKQGRGRPTKATPAVVARIVEAIEIGMTLQHVCQLVNIDYSTFAGWMKRGREGDAKYLDIFKKVKRAESKCVLNALEVIRSAAVEEKNWTAAAWILERKYPELYGKNRMQSDTVQSIELKITGLPRPKEKKTIDI